MKLVLASFSIQQRATLSTKPGLRMADIYWKLATPTFKKLKNIHYNIIIMAASWTELVSSICWISAIRTAGFPLCLLFFLTLGGGQ